MKFNLYENLSYKCPFMTFHCVKDNYCISFNQICNGLNDCFSGEDEDDCPKQITYQCLLPKQRIPIKQFCNNRKDCIDNSDEENCSKIFQ